MQVLKKCEFCKQEKKIVGRGWCNSCYQRWQKNGTPEYQRKGIRNVCEVEDCESFVVAHGLCDKHRLRLRNHGHLEPTRPNDWGKRDSHPLYSVWTTKKRFSTEQVCREWREDFWKFVKDVQERPSTDHQLRTIDDSAELSKDNFHWVKVVSKKSGSQDHKDYLKGWAREDRKRNPRKYKNKHLIKAFGITLEEYEQMQRDQDSKCAICEKGESAIDPRTKQPRELV
jgi:hypothetical protein